MLRNDRRRSGDEKRHWIVTGPSGFDPDCEVCRAIQSSPPEVAGESLFEGGIIVTPVVSMEALLPIIAAMERACRCPFCVGSSRRS